MKRFLTNLILTGLLMLALTSSVFSAETEPCQSDPLGISDWNVTLADEQEFLVPTEILQHVSEAGDIHDKSWFQSFDTSGEFVRLNSFELFTLWCYTEDETKLAALRDIYEGKDIGISYADGIISVTYTGHSSLSESTPYGAGGSSTESITIDRSEAMYNMGVKVTVTVEVYTTWIGGSTVYFEITNISNSYEKSDNPHATLIARVTEMKSEQSSGSDVSAYANVWVKAGGNLFTFSEWPAPFRFLWKDGKYTRG